MMNIKNLSIDKKENETIVMKKIINHLLARQASIMKYLKISAFHVVVEDTGKEFITIEKDNDKLSETITEIEDWIGINIDNIYKIMNSEETKKSPELNCSECKSKEY